MGMLNWLSGWLETDDGKLQYILALILIANMIDFLMGWINARFNKEVSFSSSKAIYGIARKLVLFILCIYFIPVVLIVPDIMGVDVGIGALYVLLIGYLASELNSILSHAGITSDGKGQYMFADFVNKLFGHKGTGKE